MQQVPQEIRDRVADRLQQELDDIMGRMRADPPAAGNCHTILFQDDFAAEHGISTFGRVYEDRLIDRGWGEKLPLVQCGPAVLSSELVYKVDDRTAVDWGVAFTHDHYAPFSPEDLTRDVRWPVLLKKHKQEQKQAERNLFTRFFERRTPVVAVNPSFSTLYSLNKYGGYAYWTNTSDAEATRKARLYLQELDHVEEVKNISLHDESVFYLGTASPVEYNFKQWVRLFPDPFVRSSASINSIIGQPGLRTFYLTQNRTSKDNVMRSVTVSYSESDVCITYNSPTVQKNLGGNSIYMCQTNLDMGFEEVEDKRLVCAPAYLPDLNYKWEQVDNDWFFLSGDIVADVKGPGTYFSRRCHTPLPDGFQWAPFVSQSRLFVTPICKEICTDESCRVIQAHVYGEPCEIITVGKATVIRNLERIRVPWKAASSVVGTLQQSYPPIYVDYETPDGQPLNSEVWKCDALLQNGAHYRWRSIFLPGVLASSSFIFSHRGVHDPTMKTPAYRTGSIKYMGTQYVVWPDIYRSWRYVTVLATEFEMYRRQNMGYHFRNHVISDADRGFVPSMRADVDEVAKTFVLTDWKQVGFKLSDICSRLQTTEHSRVHGALSTNRFILSWPEGTMAHLSALQIKLPGFVEPGYWDGYTVSQLLTHCTTQLVNHSMLLLKFKVCPPPELLTLFSDNAVIYDLRPADGEYLLAVRWPRAYGYNYDKKRRLRECTEADSFFETPEAEVYICSVKDPPDSAYIEENFSF